MTMIHDTDRPPDVPRKSEHELEIVAHAGQIVDSVLCAMGEAIEPGVSTAELDRRAEQIIRDADAEPSFKDYRGYPASICASPDDIIVHGIPAEDTILETGQIIGIDVGAFYEGYHGDAARTFPVGDISEQKQRLLEVTRQARDAGIAAATAGNYVKDIAVTVQEYVEQRGYSVVRNLLGHGIGTAMHQPPHVPNFFEEGLFPDYNVTLRPGMTLALEPMVNAGGFDVSQDEDGWTVRTADGSMSAHFEHTIAITKQQPRIFTTS